MDETMYFEKKHSLMTKVTDIIQHPWGYVFDVRIYYLISNLFQWFTNNMLETVPRNHYAELPHPPPPPRWLIRGDLSMVIIRLLNGNSVSGPLLVSCFKSRYHASWKDCVYCNPYSRMLILLSSPSKSPYLCPSNN